MSEEVEKSALEKWLERKKKTEKTGISKKPLEEVPVLSHGQERLWLLEQLYGGQNLYSYAHRYTFKGSINLDLLLQCFQKLVKKHEILRTTYQQENDQVTQHVLSDFNLSFTNLDSEKKSLNENVKSFIQQPFDLSKDLPIRLGIIQLDESNTELILVLHHIAGDAWSMNVINKELSTAYAALIAREDQDEDSLPIQYSDYAFWQRNQAIKSKDLAYWKSHLEGEAGYLNLPKEKSESTFKGQTRKRKLSENLSDEIRKIAKDQQVTSYVFWLATFKLFLSKYANQPTLTIGSPFSNRDKKELESLVGFFNETLVLKADLEEDIPFSEFIQKTSKVVLDGIAHKNVPFETLVNELKPDRAAGDNPLFSAMFLYNSAATGLNIHNVSVTEEVLDVGVSKFDLTLFVNEGEEIELALEYSTSFEDDFISSLMDHYEIMLTNIVADPTEKTSSIPLLSKNELNLLTKEWNDTSEEVPNTENILGLIQPHFSTSPDSVAVSYNDESLTYQQLDQWSNFISEKLVSNGVKANQFVGIYSHRSLEMIVAIVGILKAGAAYLPLDPKYPEQRLQMMMEDAGASHVLVHPDQDASLNGSKIKIEKGVSEKEINTSIPKDNYAYIIYTSGSTGKPKGVPVTHENLIYSTSARYSFYEDPMQKFLLLSSFSFDSSIVGIFWALTTGGNLILPPERIEQDVDALAKIIQEYEVTHTLMLPSLYQVLLNFADTSRLHSLRAVMVAGEAVSSKVRKDHFNKLSDTRLYNEYGPTETTVWCVAHEIKQVETEGAIPIGNPVPNYQGFVLDRHRNPMPIALEGELYIGGKAVTDGYLDKPELTKEKFIENPFGEGRLYRSGDLVKWRKNGLLDFLGRKDDQIKIRGQRVEKDEIKSVLLSISDVTDVEVQVLNERNTLMAYLECDNEIDQFILKEEAKKMLPEHMVPAHFVCLKSLPKLPNGKIDISKLPEVEETGNEFVSPRNETEEKLAEIWQEVLQLDQVGVNDNFFELGGDSIQSIKVIAKAQKHGIHIEATGIFKHQTIAALAQSLSDIKEKEDWSAIVPMKADGHLPPLFCLHSGGAHVMFYREFANLMGDDHPVYAIQPKGLDSKQTYHQTIPEMAAMYISEIKKVQPKGPYHLLGTCFSNAVGLDMIHQLKANGDEIAIFYVVDSGPAYLVPPSPNGEKMPVRRMMNMVLEGNWSGIYKKFRNRFIYLNRRLTRNRTSEVQKDLYDMVDSLNQLYSSYTWKPIDEKVVLIRSTEFANRKNKQFHIDHWTKLSSGQLETHVVDGHHKTLFQQPEVKGLAELISSHKSRLNKEPASNE